MEVILLHTDLNYVNFKMFLLISWIILHQYYGVYQGK